MALNLDPEDKTKVYAFAFFVAVVILVVIGMTTATSIGDSRRRAAVAPWQALVDSYMPADKLHEVQSAAFTVDPAVKTVMKGRVVPVNIGTRVIDDIYFKLPRELKSTTPDDVGTVLWLEWGHEDVGKYTNGAPARVQTCKVTVVDKGTLTVLGQRRFRGLDPPERIDDRSFEGLGSVPIPEILDYLERLPRAGG